MNTIDSTSAASPAPQPAPSNQLKADSQTFLKLLSEQLRQQDPMKPQDSSAFMAQLSQMTMVEQMTALTTAQTRSNALSLLGKTVSWLDETGATQTGKVDSVDVTGPALNLENGSRIDPQKVQSVSG